MTATLSELNQIEKEMISIIWRYESQKDTQQAVFAYFERRKENTETLRVMKQ